MSRRTHRMVKRSCYQAAYGFMAGAFLFIIMSIFIVDLDNMFATRLLQNGAVVFIIGALFHIAGDVI